MHWHGFPGYDLFVIYIPNRGFTLCHIVYHTLQHTIHYVTPILHPHDYKCSVVSAKAKLWLAEMEDEERRARGRAIAEDEEMQVGDQFMRIHRVSLSVALAVAVAAAILLWRSGALGAF